MWLQVLGLRINLRKIGYILEAHTFLKRRFHYFKSVYKCATKLHTLPLKDFLTNQLKLRESYQKVQS